jgi:CheY-like chemotaxis protein
MAEDNAFNQRVVRLMLGRAGHSVTIANNGREAVAAMEREPFDLVLMDLQMPEMDGFQATAAIRAAEAGGRRRAPIIALTAHAMKEDRLRCLEAGMDGYLSKPIREEMLRRAVEDCMPLIDANAVAAVSDEPPVCPWDDAMDVEAALAQVDGDRGFLAEMARMYLDESPVLLARIQAAVAAGDPAALVAPAHSLKNWFGNFAARLAYDTVRDLENLGRAGDLATAATTLAKLQGEIGRLALAMATLEPWTVPTDLDNEPLAITIGSGSPPCTR